MPLVLDPRFYKVKSAPINKLYVGLVAMLVVSIVIYIASVIMTNKLRTARKNPWIIEGVREANKPLVLSQNIVDENSIPIIRSSNEDEGIEFSYSFWIIIRDWRYKYGEWKHIFHKGNSTSWPNRAPGAWLHKTQNNMRIYMNVHNKVDEYVDIDDIPINKWVHIVISVVGQDLDTYINGNLIKRHRLSGIPKQNFNNLNITNFGGFGGFIGRFRYFSYALSSVEIFDESKNVPSLSSIQIRTDKPPYLSYRWGENV